MVGAGLPANIGAMKAPATMQSLSRALAILRVLAAHDGQGINAIATATGLSRGTCHRLLEALRGEGCVLRDPVDRRYWLDHGIGALAHAQRDGAWVRGHALPLMEALTERILWPVSLAEPRDGRMMVLASTDRRSGLARVRVPAGFAVPLATSASGQVWLAFAPGDREQADEGARAKIREDGYKLTIWPEQVYTLAVPVLRDGVMRACLVLRVFAGAMGPMQVVTRFLGDLQDTAQAIACRIGGH